MQTESKTELDVVFPHSVPDRLRAAARMYYEATRELQDAFGLSTGLVWSDFADILNDAASRCEAALRRRGVL